MTDFLGIVYQELSFSRDLKEIYKVLDAISGFHSRTSIFRFRHLGLGWYVVYGLMECTHRWAENAGAFVTFQDGGVLKFNG